MVISYRHESVRLTGRWDMRDERVAVTTTTGAYLEFAFEGRMALVRFDVMENAYPRLHLWVQLDGGDMIETPIDAYLRVCAKEEGKHVCRIIYKGGTEADRRWYAPLTGKVSFLGVQVEKPAELPADERPIIEFVGDSITEGVLIDMDYKEPEDVVTYIDLQLRIYQDDVCATYAWQTAEALGLRPIFMGYGAVGVTRAGMGKVPAVTESYGFNFDGSPITHGGQPRYVMINHGANDRRATPEEYTAKYTELLDTIRRYNPNATLIVVSPFCGAFQEALADMVKAYNEKNGTTVHFINAGNVIPPEPLHPWRDGHRAVAEYLIPRVREIIG